MSPEPGTEKGRTTTQLPQLVCIVVTYQPDLATLTRQFETLPPECALVIVDNASGASTLERFDALTEGRARTTLLSNTENRGLAAAINQGVSEVSERWPDIEFLLLLDQDSVPAGGSVEILLEQLQRLSHADPAAACVGPTLVDPVTGLTHGFHCATRWRWMRVHPDPLGSSPITCSNLNGSGTMVPIDLFRSLNGLEEDFFIDHIDTEWSFRVLAAGYGLYGIPAAVFEHHMGESSRRIWLFGWRAWPMRPPRRHFYLYRNAVFLMGRSYVPKVWKVWAVAKLLLTTLIHVLIDPERWTQLGEMSRGVRAGLTRRAPARNVDPDKKNP